MTNSTLADAYIDTLSFGCYDLCVVKKGSKTLSIMNLCVDLKFFFFKKKKWKKERKKANENYIIRITSSITNEFYSKYKLYIERIRHKWNFPTTSS